LAALLAAPGDAAPIFVFIRGGAWHSGPSKDFAAPAEMFLAVGAHYVVPDFAWVQDVGGSLMVLADQVRRAIAWVYENAVLLGSDRKQIYVGGQSSGPHLAPVALTTDWPRRFSQSAAEGPMVRRLAAGGGSQVRTRLGKRSERRQIGRFCEDWERFLMPQSAFSLLQIPKMVAFLPIVAGPGDAH
jgi:carboxylesterase type B